MYVFVCAFMYFCFALVVAIVVVVVRFAFCLPIRLFRYITVVFL